MGRSISAHAANAVQALVSRRRGVVGRDTVEFGPAGYRLVVDQDAVDARVFEQQVAAGRRALADGRLAETASLLAEALGQWRGPALADVADVPFAAAAITRLSELRLAALEDRIDAELAPAARAVAGPADACAPGGGPAGGRADDLRGHPAGRWPSSSAPIPRPPWPMCIWLS